MIRIHLSELLGRKKMTKAELSRITGIRPGTLGKLYYEESKRIDVAHLDAMCKAFDCGIGDLMEYVKDDVNKK